MLLLFIFTMIPLIYGQSMDQIQINSMNIEFVNGTINCKMYTGIQIDSHNFTSTCYTDGIDVILIADSSIAFTSKNLSISLNLNNADPFTGFWTINDTLPSNTPHFSEIILKGARLAVTTTTKIPESPTPTILNETTTRRKESAESQEQLVSLKIQWVRIKFDESPKNNNGAAVAVAVIEGLALVAILGFMGYRIMKSGRSTPSNANPASYGYENNARNVEDVMRMNSSSTRNTPVVSTPELVVPSVNETGAQRFQDPFATLDSW